MPPAARVGDMHVCPMVTGIVPHVGGPILPPGGLPVFTGNLPQARLTDMCTCVGPPDIIALGSAGVFVGKLPAARMGDLCAHGGSIIMGWPTVLIGEVMSGTLSTSQLEAMDIMSLVATIARSGSSDGGGHGESDGQAGEEGSDSAGDGATDAPPPAQPVKIEFANAELTAQAMETAGETGTAFVEPCFGKGPLQPPPAPPPSAASSSTPSDGAGTPYADPDLLRQGEDDTD